MFEHRTYAPVSSHFAVPNPEIDFTGLRVQTEPEAFGGGPVTIGINSFGFGGANGHCLLTEYRPGRGPAYSRPPARAPSGRAADASSTPASPSSGAPSTHAAGIFSLEEATRLVFHRAPLQQRTAGSGRMLAVSLDRAGAEEILSELGAGTLEIACENAPASTVICGPAADLAQAAALLERRGVPHRLLRGNVAFHSRAMDVIEAELRTAPRSTSPSPATRSSSGRTRCGWSRRLFLPGR